ncbi:hypothetical protein FB451DRAFT_1406715 [Mycena latifolia]|nr:hypothetical protein FB451DRAFT_1406715 [Mycena latifolia]
MHPRLFCATGVAQAVPAHAALRPSVAPTCSDQGCPLHNLNHVQRRKLVTRAPGGGEYFVDWKEDLKKRVVYHASGESMASPCRSWQKDNPLLQEAVVRIP